MPYDDSYARAQGVLDVREAYALRKPQGYWFSPSTMHFFRSRLGKQYYRKADDSYVFVTGETDFSDRRAYSVRVMTKAGDIVTVGPFCKWTKGVANRAARQIAMKGEAEVKGKMWYHPGHPSFGEGREP